MAKDLTTRAENYSQWYNDLVIKARAIHSTTEMMEIILITFLDFLEMRYRFAI